MRGFLLALLLPFPASAGGPQDVAYYYEQIHEPFFRKNEKAGIWEPNRPGSNPSRHAIEKAPGTFRVFVLGGSVAARSMGDQILERRLRQALPKTTVEAVNCGMGGYDSAREAMVLEEVLGHEPDLVVLISGHNESISGPPVPLWRLRAKLFLDRWEIFRRMTPRPQGRMLTAAAAEKRNENLRANHVRMLAAAKRAGVPVLSISPPVNWRDAPTGSPFALNRTGFVEGWIALLRREPAKAIEIWKTSLAEPDAADAGLSRSLTAFCMAKAAEQLGRQKEANALFERAMDEDWITIGRCGPRCSKVIRETAAEGGAAWLDLDAKFRAQTAPRLPGLDMFCDEVHWLRGWDAFAAVQVIEAIAGLPAFKSLPWDQKALAALRAEAAKRPPLTELDAMETLRYAMSSMNRPDAMLSSRALTFLETVHERRPAWFTDLEGAAARAAADGQGRGAAWGMPKLEPSIPKLYWYSGVVVMRRVGAKAALPYFAKALALDSSLKGARIGRAIAFELAGRKPDAENELQALGDDDQVRADARAVAEALGYSR